MARYPNIADHGLIGDLQTAALVTTDGVLDWFCCPRFDSPSVFASLLDADRGGFFRIAPDRDDYVARQLYLPDTAVLITRFMTPDGVGEVHDFMPVIEGPATGRHRLVRNIRVVRGVMRFAIEIQPRFDYGRKQHELEAFEHGGVFRSEDLELTAHAIAPEGATLQQAGVTLQRDGDGVRWTRTLREGESGGVVLESMGGTPRLVTPEEAQRLEDDTARFWRGWLHRSSYRGRWREMVARSAITLKLMTYAPTGAPVAAPTTGLPEQEGGERNWDYRYTWIRDGSFSIYALLGLGYVEEAAAFGVWLKDRVQEQAGNASGPLKIMYRVDGTSDLVEESLDHFEGWRGSRPVRIGNGAADQLQLDIYGELIDSVYLYNKYGEPISYDAWMDLVKVLEWLCKNWDRPDEGIWETRGGRQHFTYSRLMSWVAIERAIRMARQRGLPADLVSWLAARDKLTTPIMTRGWNEKRQAFVQHYDTDVLDASVLLMPLTRFIAPKDPRWLSTLDAIGNELVSDSLVYRYNAEASPDGLRGDEGTFSICSFWYVEALARAGRLDEARLAFEKMLTYANHLGLYSEEIGPTGESLGNFPQAFTHLGLISAAFNLDQRLG